MLDVAGSERAGGRGGLVVRGLAGARCPLVRCRMRGLDGNTGAHTCCASEIPGELVRRVDPWGFPGGPVVKNPSADAGDMG